MLNRIPTLLKIQKIRLTACSLFFSFILLAGCQPATTLTPRAVRQPQATALPVSSTPPATAAVPAPADTEAPAGSIAASTATAEDTSAAEPSPETAPADDAPVPVDAVETAPAETLLPTEAPSPEPTAAPPGQEAREQLGEIPSAEGPKPLYFPAPGDSLEAWDSLAGATVPQNLQWAKYTGKIESSPPGSTADITFKYPASWKMGSLDTTQHISVLNTLAGQAEDEFLKLEILFNASRPNVTSEQAGDFQAHAVEIAGGPGLLIVYTQDPGTFQVLSVIFKHNDAWYIAAGYINLAKPDAARVDRDRAMLYSLFQSIRLAP